MEAFLNWFSRFIQLMLDGGIWRILENFFWGMVRIFNFPVYFELVSRYSDDFGAVGWILCIACFLLVFGIWAALLLLLVIACRKHLRSRRTLVASEDLLEEIADLHADVVRLTKDRERLLSHQLARAGGSDETLREPLSEAREDTALFPGADGENAEQSTGRFCRLSAVDKAYIGYRPPDYDLSMDLACLCEDLRNFAGSRMHLYYDIKTVRLMLAGLASTKLILLQGVSGTGKTSLPYCMGKYFRCDTTIAPVQPSWRDRTELFGYFNEFTKKFNETEVLRRIYESGYNDDINLIVLDELNIARVEYYFAEMLSVLEMPNTDEWRISLVAASWQNDPVRLRDGFLEIPENIWYIGTANNDDSTFAISDKVYDRALVINLDSKGVAFDAPATEAKRISYTHMTSLFEQAVADFPVSDDSRERIRLLDAYVLQHFRVAFGNRIIKQLLRFVPVYVACGGTESDAIDYLLATKVLRKLESLNLSLIRDELDGLTDYIHTLFGRDIMVECIACLDRLKKLY